MLSEYSLGRYGSLMRIAFVAAASAVMAIAAALRGVSGSTVPFLLVIVAIGPLGRGVRRHRPDHDPAGPAVEAATRSTRRSGSLFILGFPAASTIVGIRISGEPTIGPILAWASLVAWVGLALFIGATIRYMRPGVMAGPTVQIGWPNRLNMLAYLAWVSLAAVTVLG